MDEEKNEQVNASASLDDRKGFNITSMVLGIISVVSFCWWFVSLPCGIIAIIFGIAGRDRGGRGMGVAGLILGIIGVVLCILVILGIASLIGIGTSAVNSLNYYYY